MLSTRRLVPISFSLHLVSPVIPRYDCVMYVIPCPAAGCPEKTQKIKDNKKYATVMVVSDGVTISWLQSSSGTCRGTKGYSLTFSFFAIRSIGLPGVNWRIGYYFPFVCFLFFYSCEPNCFFCFLLEAQRNLNKRWGGGTLKPELLQWRDGYHRMALFLKE